MDIVKKAQELDHNGKYAKADELDRRLVLALANEDAISKAIIMVKKLNNIVAKSDLASYNMKQYTFNVSNNVLQALKQSTMSQKEIDQSNLFKQTPEGKYQYAPEGSVLEQGAEDVLGIKAGKNKTLQRLAADSMYVGISNMIAEIEKVLQPIFVSKPDLRNKVMPPLESIRMMVANPSAFNGTVNYQPATTANPESM